MDDSTVLVNPLKTIGDMRRMLQQLDIFLTVNIEMNDWHAYSSECGDEDHAIDGYAACRKDIEDYLTGQRG